VLRYFGVEGIRERLRAHIEMAASLGREVSATEGWELAAPVSFSTVALRFTPAHLDGPVADRTNLEIMERVNRTGEVFLSHTVLGGRTAIRLTVGNLRTTPAHVGRAWELLKSAARDVAPAPSGG
jgi:aromatic-L-amino-acid decarboxylase